MPWNKATQEEYKRNGKELEATLTDVEWQLIEPLLPAPLRPDSSGPRGRPRTTDQGRTLRVRAVFDAIQFILGTGCQWRQLPRCFPPFTTVRTDSSDQSRTGIVPQDPKSPTFVILELLARAPTVEKLLADGAYAGPKLAGRLKKLELSDLLEIVTKPKGKTRRVRL